VNNTIYHPEMTTEQTNRSEETINEMRSINVKIDYSQPLNESIVWNMGYQLFHRQIFNDFIDSDNAIEIEYLDYRNSFYGDFAYKKGKFSFRAGVRLEHLTIDISDTLSSQDLHPLPLGSIMYSINQRNNISFTYNRRLRYPS
ncbi:outer membrane beta-barrel protein, partial [Desulfonatronum sp. SC1]|uniref:outer membrane beta-barrel protein n=1 Tax=Desulfonatronum sp. SC1 TaxID=2109626 RepID=UPI000D4BFBD6